MSTQLSQKSQLSLYSNCPDISFPRASRESRSKLHISREHDQSAPNSSTPGPVYDLPSTLGHSHSCRFGKGPRDFTDVKHSDLLISTDALGIIPDSQALRFMSTVSVKIGTESRDEIHNAAVMKYNPQTFYGLESPGSATYMIPSQSDSPKYTFGSRTEALGSKIQTPPAVGPGSYPHPTYCGKLQSQSQIANQPVFTFGKSSCAASQQQVPKAGKRAPGVIVDGIGPQVLSTKRTGPRPVLGTQTREQWAKVAPVIPKRDRCDVASFPIPKMLPRTEIIKWSS